MLIMQGILKRAALPRMRDKIPVDRGRLRDSLKITFRRRENEILVRFEAKGFYWHLVPGVAKSIEDIAADIISSNAQPALNLAVRRVLPPA